MPAVGTPRDERPPPTLEDRLENTGLRVIEVTDVDAFLEDTVGSPPEWYHAIRLDATGRDWSALRAAGAVVRPTWVHWMCQTTGGSADLLARQARKRRNRTRAALRFLAGMTMEVHDPVDPVVFEEWLELYTAQVATMRHGRNLARIVRTSLLSPDSQHGLVVWRTGGRLVCGCIVRFEPEHAALIIRFAAVASEARDSELPRGMYASLADIAAARGLRWTTLGGDVNFYGAVHRPGLCGFKLRLGFRPVPADLLGRRCRDIAERVVSLDGLDVPVLRFEYPGERDPAARLEDYLDGSAALRLVTLMPAGGHSTVLESLPEHRELVLDA